MDLKIGDILIVTKNIRRVSDFGIYLKMGSKVRVRKIFEDKIYVDLNEKMYILFGSLDLFDGVVYNSVSRVWDMRNEKLKTIGI
jgi:hypothetical protein